MSGAACTNSKNGSIFIFTGQKEDVGEEEARMCACCGAEAGVKMCSGCHSTYYCGTACQKSHWSGGHKKECAELGKAYAHEKRLGYYKKIAEGQYEGARKNLEKSLQVQREQVSKGGSDGADLGRSLARMGEILFMQGNYDEALKKFMEGLQVSRKEVGNDHEDVAYALLNIARVFEAQGKPEVTLRKYEQALQIFLKVQGPQNAVIFKCHFGLAYQGIGRAHTNLKQHDKALEYFEKAVEILCNTDLRDARCFEEEKPFMECYVLLVNIGQALTSQGKHELALGKYEEALQMVLQEHGLEHPMVASTYISMSKPCRLLGQHDKALEYLDKALVTRLKVFGSEHIDVAKTRYEMGLCHFDQGSYGRAKELFEEGSVVYSRVYGPDHQGTKNIIEQARLAGSRLM